LFTGVGLTHAKDVTNRTTRRVAHHHDPSMKAAVTDDSTLAIVLASVLDLDSHSSENENGVFEVEATI